MNGKGFDDYVELVEKLSKMKMEVENVPGDDMVNNRAMWLKHEQMSYLQKSKLRRKYLNIYVMRVSEEACRLFHHLVQVS